MRRTSNLGEEDDDAPPAVAARHHSVSRHTARSAPLPAYTTTFMGVHVRNSRAQWPRVVRGATTRKGAARAKCFCHHRAAAAWAVLPRPI